MEFEKELTEIDRQLESSDDENHKKWLRKVKNYYKKESNAGTSDSKTINTTKV